MTGPLDAVVAGLADLWARRPPAERSAFREQLTRTSSQDAPPADAASRVRTRAALSGVVAPWDLVAGLELGPGVADQLLSYLLAEFDRLSTSDGWRWTLRSGPRTAVLSTLVTAAGDVVAALADAAQVPTDSAGMALRDVAARVTAGSVPTLPGETNVWLQALTWAAPLGGLAGDLAEARRLAGLQAVRANYRGLLRDGFVGRAAELRTLEVFATEPAEPGPDLPVLSVTGIGGAGKSTLLGAFVEPNLRRAEAGDGDGPITIVIDFDRVLYRAGAELELSFEFTRQLGHAVPAASADFAVLRRQTRAERIETGDDTALGGSAAESGLRGSFGFDIEAATLVRLHDLDRRPVVVVLDTFEEWQRDRLSWEDWSWHGPEQRIVEWLQGLRDMMGIGALRVIFSGRRTFDLGEGPWPGVQLRETVELGDLPGADARALLRALKVPVSARSALVRAAGRNPLTLRVAAQFYARLASEESTAFLAAEPELRTNLDEDLRRAVLYDRFLAHIRPEVRRVAHPGLVLRRVSPQLIRGVLADVCQLGPLDDRSARALLDALGDEVWLVSREPDGQLRHIPDVRRAMLRMMTADPAHAADVQRIHRLAAEWYRDHPDGIRTGPASVERFYHLMMVDPAGQAVSERFEPGEVEGDDDPWLAELSHALGSAVEELPDAAAAQVRVLRGETVPDADAILLPDGVWSAWVDRRGAALLQRGEAGRAVDLYLQRRRSGAAAEAGWLAQAFCDLGRWGEYWAGVQPAHGLGLWDPTRVVMRRSDRYAIANALFSGERSHLVTCATYVQYMHAYHSDPPTAEVRRFFGILLNIADDSQPTMYGHEPSTTAPIDLYPVDRLRRALVWASDDRSLHRTNASFFELDRPAELFRPDPAWVRAFAALTGADNPRIQDLCDELETLRDEARAGRADVRVDQLLGEWATRFGRIVGSTRVGLNGPDLAYRGEHLWVLRGDNPELRPVVRLALGLAIGSRPDELVAVVDAAADILPLTPADLLPRRLRTSTGSKTIDDTVVRLVEYADRSGKLPELLDIVATRVLPGRTELLDRVQSALRYWNTLNLVVLDDLHRRLSGGP